MLTRTFKILNAGGLTAFTLFWHTLDAKWAKETAFYNRLFQITIQNSNAYEVMIDAKATKWDSKRIVLVDKIILKLALAEMLEFKEIPFKVAINEYIEIAKLYSTSKGSQFVNGVLEGIWKEL